MSTAVPTVARPAAPWLAWGVSVSLVAFALLLAPVEGFTWAGWVCLLVALPLLATGVLRLVQHADRAAGVLYKGPGQAAAPMSGTEIRRQDAARQALVRAAETRRQP